jgi:hypothetical protein
LRRMRWVRHTAQWGIGEVHTEFWGENLRDRAYLEDPGMNGGEKNIKKILWTHL